LKICWDWRHHKEPVGCRHTAFSTFPVICELLTTLFWKSSAIKRVDSSVKLTRLVDSSTQVAVKPVQCLSYFATLPYNIQGYSASIHNNMSLLALSATNLCYMALYNNSQLVHMFQCFHTSSLNLFTNFHTTDFPGTQHQNQ
jgi:hypothetical protein